MHCLNCLSLPNETKRNFTAAIRDAAAAELIRRQSIKDPKLLEDLLYTWSTTLPTLFPIPNIVNFFKSNQRQTSYDTVSDYMGILLIQLFVHKTERYHIGERSHFRACQILPSTTCRSGISFIRFGYGVGYQLENLGIPRAAPGGIPGIYTSIWGVEIGFCLAIKGPPALCTERLSFNMNQIQREYASWNR